jgi:hypothetical protein
VSLLWIVRLFTAIVSLLHVVYNVNWNNVPMFFDFGLSYVGQGGYALLMRAGAVGVHISAFASVVVAFLCIPRWRSGTALLSWCLLLMVLSLLSRLGPAYWNPALPWVFRITSDVFPLIFAMPPFILAIILRHPAIETEIHRAR